MQEINKNVVELSIMGKPAASNFRVKKKSCIGKNATGYM